MSLDRTDTHAHLSFDFFHAKFLFTYISVRMVNWFLDLCVLRSNLWHKTDCIKVLLSVIRLMKKHFCSFVLFTRKLQHSELFTLIREPFPFLYVGFRRLNVIQLRLVCRPEDKLSSRLPTLTRRLDRCMYVAFARCLFNEFRISNSTHLSMPYTAFYFFLFPSCTPKWQILFTNTSVIVGDLVSLNYRRFCWLFLVLDIYSISFTLNLFYFHFVWCSSPSWIPL